MTARLRAVLRSGGYSYLLYVPPDGPDWPGGGPRPLLLFLHGIGERGSDLDEVARHGPPREVEAGRDLPFVVAAPQCPAGHYWSLPLLGELLNHLLAAHPVDPDRVYLTGLSMGAHAVWALGMAEPWRFAALAPVCGGGDPRKAGRLARVPVWAFHGAQDPVVPVASSRTMVAALRRCGGRAELTEYPDAGHDAWTRAYGGDALYRWFLGHSRRRARTPAPAEGAPPGEDPAPE